MEKKRKEIKLDGLRVLVNKLKLKPQKRLDWVPEFSIPHKWDRGSHQVDVVLLFMCKFTERPFLFWFFFFLNTPY